jgi:LPXTG-motif cell wall-anchored protein
MKHLNCIQVVACSALFVAALIPSTVRADEWDKRTLITFSDTVRVPGATLPAGTYVFKLAESNADRYIVQIFNERENHVFATILAIPDYHMTPSGKTLVTFYEAPTGQPLAVKDWFYPGDNTGRQFVYKKHEAALIASTETVRTEETSGIVAPPPAQIAQSAVPPQPEPAVTVETPVPVETPVVVAEPEPPPVVKREEVTAESTVPEPAPEPITTLPSTGTEWPLAGLIGLSSLAAGFALRAVRRSR